MDPITSKTIRLTDIRTDVVKSEAPVAKASPVSAVSKTADVVVSTASETAKSLATTAPVDVDRVARIKRAVQEGRFPIFPSTIADRLIAFEQGWRGYEQA